MISRRAHFCIYHLDDISCLNHATKLTGFGASSLALVGPHSGTVIGNVSVRRVNHAKAREDESMGDKTEEAIAKFGWSLSLHGATSEQSSEMFRNQWSGIQLDKSVR